MPSEQAFPLRIQMVAHTASAPALLQSTEWSREHLEADWAELLARVEAFVSNAEKIDVDAGLNVVGKKTRLGPAAEKGLADVRAWAAQHEKRFGALEARGSTLIQQATRPAPPTTEAVAALGQRVASFGPTELQQLWRAADDATKRVIEAHVRLTNGKLPIKSDFGARWVDALDAQELEAVIREREARWSPTGAALRNDVAMLAPVYAMLAKVAEGIVRDLVGRHGVTVAAPTTTLRDPRTGIAIRVPFAPEPPTAA